MRYLTVVFIWGWSLWRRLLFWLFHWCRSKRCQIPPSLAFQRRDNRRWLDWWVICHLPGITHRSSVSIWAAFLFCQRLLKIWREISLLISESGQICHKCLAIYLTMRNLTIIFQHTEYEEIRYCWTVETKAVNVCQQGTFWEVSSRGIHWQWLLCHCLFRLWSQLKTPSHQGHWSSHCLSN